VARGPVSYSDWCFEDPDLHLEHYLDCDGAALETTIVSEKAAGIWEFGMDEFASTEASSQGQAAQRAAEAALKTRFGANWQAKAAHRGRMSRMQSCSPP